MLYRSLCIFGFSGCLWITAPARAETLSIAQTNAAYQEQHYSEAFAILRTLANQGNAEAQYKLATSFYATGIGTPQNAAAALHWIKQSAQQGYIPAQKTLPCYMPTAAACQKAKP